MPCAQAVVSECQVILAGMRVMLNDAGQGKEHLVSDKQTGVSAATASQTLRGASVGAFPPSTFRSITEAAAALSQLPSFQTLAAAGIQPNVAMMQTAGLAAKLSARYEVPSIARVAVDLAPQLRGIDIMNAAGIASSLDAALATFRPQRVMFDAIIASGLGRHNAAFAAQAAQILSSQQSIGRLVASSGRSAAMAGLFATMGRYGQVQAHLGSFAVDPAIATLLRGSTRVAGRRYDAYLNGLPARPMARRAAVARHAGDTQTGLLIAESLTAAGLDDDDRDELAQQLTVVTLEAWQTGPADARDDLFEALAELDPSLPDWLKAAWEDIVRDGPKAASKIANCTIECIDQALRIVAPVDDVTAWVAHEGARQGWMERNRPTRRAKVMFVMRHRSNRDARLAVSQVEALATLVQHVAGNLQSVKHGEAPAMAVMRGWVQATEGALSQLLLHQ